jgi:hypothetical protein
MPAVLMEFTPDDLSAESLKDMFERTAKNSRSRE